ncbi:MAG TPA: sulfotransferase [Woeseiaceae bacterium]|nr:sulfotransferase [Woeseiaceae bacterium]
MTLPETARSRNRFTEVITLIARAEYGKALQVCEEHLRALPDDVNILGLAGAVLIKLNRLDEAIQVLQQVIQLAPTFAKPHEDLGLALFESARYAEARPVLDNAVRLDPSLELAWLNLGKTIAALGDGRSADAAFERAFELNPERRLLALAAEHHKEGRLEQAERMYRQIVQSNPKNVDAIRLLGRVALSAKKNSEAEQLFRRAVNIAPDFVGAINDLGRVLKEQDLLEEAIECFERVTELQPRNAHAYFMLAGALAPAARTYDAIKIYEKALQFNPGHAGARLGLGHVLKTVGRQDEAVVEYRESIRIKPDSGESYWSLANLKTYRLSDTDIEAIGLQMENDELAEQARVNFLFALAKAAEDRGDYDTAWTNYVRGNELQRGQVSYDPVQTEVLTNSLQRVFDKELFADKKGAGNPDDSPIFIVGLPRSGSTLIEQILASHSDVEGTSELPYLGRVATSLNRNRADGINYPEAARELNTDNFAALGRDYLDHARRHRTEGKPHFIDKMPNNFPSIGFLHLILPNAIIIDARRHPLDACLGGYRQLFAKGQTFTYDLTDIGEYFLQYEHIMDHWHEVLPGRVLTMQYEELVTDFENQVERLLAHCGLPFDANCLRFHETDRPVRTASSEQVRQPIYKSAIGFWRNYEAQLTELIQVLEPSLPRYAKYL